MTNERNLWFYGDDDEDDEDDEDLDKDDDEDALEEDDDEEFDDDEDWDDSELGCTIGCKTRKKRSSAVP